MLAYSPPVMCGIARQYFAMIKSPLHLIRHTLVSHPGTCGKAISSAIAEATRHYMRTQLTQFSMKQLNRMLLRQAERHKRSLLSPADARI